MKRTLGLACALLLLCPALLPAQSRIGKEAVVIFKDGFYVKGFAVQKKDLIVDPYSGSSVPVPAGGEYLHVDDGLRRFYFSLGQVQEVLDVKNDPAREQLRFVREAKVRSRGEPFPIGTTFEDLGEWNNKWERVLKIRTQKGIVGITQRITAITPTVIIGRTVRYSWDFAFGTKEFSPLLTRRLILDFLTEKTQLKEFERRALVAKFFAQAGITEMAEQELAQLAEQFPEESKKVKDLRAQVRQQQADTDAEEIERMHRVGWHTMAQEGLAAFARDEEKTKGLSDKNRLALQEIKSRYETWNTQLAQAKEFLKCFPRETDEDRAVWAAAGKFMLEGLSYDSLGRLKTFLELAPQHARAIQEGKKPTQKTEDVLALAVTGWLQGDDAAVTDRKAAVLLVRTREMLLNYLRTENPIARQQLYSSFAKNHEVPLDTIIRMIRFMPPTHPPAEKLRTDSATKLSIDVPGTNGGDYFVQLPPDYQPQRPYPVLVLLHSHREKPDVLIKRWQEQGARHGFILVAPLWGGDGKRPKYEYTKDEHAIVLDSLRDVRRRFNVDSDRVFLFGWEQGANAAFDIGLAHPDQFAGVLPMNGDVSGFPHRYASNAQYLPFYIVEGDRNGVQPKNIRILLKDWIRGHYPSLYVEYKGRGSEWYSAELPQMMDWIGRKKRFHPLKQMGRYHTGGGIGEEFKTMRACDNRFYWLSTDEIGDRHLNSYHSWSKTVRPATLQATIAQVNEASKTSERIWTQINIRTLGVKQVSLWLAPNQVDFSHPVAIRIDNERYGGQRMIRPSVPILLEELINSGDRERLFVARLDFQL